MGDVETARDIAPSVRVAAELLPVIGVVDDEELPRDFPDVLSTCLQLGDPSESIWCAPSALLEI